MNSQRRSTNERFFYCHLTSGAFIGIFPAKQKEVFKMEPVQIVSIMERIMGANPVILLKSHAGQPKLKYTATAAGGKDTFATPMLCQTWFDAILALRDFPISEGPVCIPSELTEAIERIFEGMEKYLVLSKLHNSTFSIITVPSTAKVPLLIAKQITGAINEFAGQFPAP